MVCIRGPSSEKNNMVVQATGDEPAVRRLCGRLASGGGAEAVAVCLRERGCVREAADRGVRRVVDGVVGERAAFGKGLLSGRRLVVVRVVAHGAFLVVSRERVVRVMGATTGYTLLSRLLGARVPAHVSGWSRAVRSRLWALSRSPSVFVWSRAT